MPTQKLFKQRVRARMSKTGESYTAARHQLLRKTSEPAGPPGEETAVPPAPREPHESSLPVETPEPGTPPTTGAAADEIPTDAFGVSDEAMRRATGKRHAEWFALLDDWGATGRGHTDIARWLSEAQGVPPWWTQSVTVAYERARGMRGRHQMTDGYSVSATKTIATEPARLLEAFTDASLRSRWLAEPEMRQRPTRASLSARFDWADPPSRVVVTVVPKSEGKAVVAVAHEQLPDAEVAGRLKVAWRERLGQLKELLEGG